MFTKMQAIPMPASEAKSPLASALGAASVSNETRIRITSDFRILLSSSAGFGLHHTALGQCLQQMRECALDIIAVLRFERHLHHVLRVTDLRVGPEQKLGEYPECLVQMLRDRSLALARVNNAEVEGIRRKALPDCEKLRLQDL